MSQSDPEQISRYKNFLHISYDAHEIFALTQICGQTTSRVDGAVCC